ncbi:MAG: cell division protein FtsH, cell division protease FtsH, partial [Candidatus Parcubacteria bacterium]
MNEVDLKKTPQPKVVMKDNKKRGGRDGWMPRVPTTGSDWGGGLTTAILVLLVLSAAYSYFWDSGEDTLLVPLSAVATDIRAGIVERITIAGDSLDIAYRDGTKKEAKKESDESLSTSLANLGLTGAELAPIAIEIKDESGFKYWFFSLAPILLPLILIGVFVWFLSRQVRGAGMQAFTFGQSKARMIDPRDSAQRVTFADVAGAKEAKEELTE